MTSQIQRILFPKAGRVRARRVVSRSNARSTGKYPSWKMRRSLHWESINELYAFRLLDCDPKVKCFTEQPCEIEYEINGEMRRHFPDILVEIGGRKELWEVKTKKDANASDVVTRTSLLECALPFWGYHYRLVLADQLAVQPYLDNVNLLLSFGRAEISEVHREVARRFLLREESITWADVCIGVLGKRGRWILCRLVLEGTLIVDMRSPIGPNTVFRLKRSAL
jgi:hypothetical protein